MRKGEEEEEEGFRGSEVANMVVVGGREETREVNQDKIPYDFYFYVMVGD